MYHNPLFIKTFYLCKIANEQLLWRNYNRVFDKLYMFYCVVSGNLLHTFYFRSGKKYCCTVICGHSSFYWIVSRWADENGFERKRNFMIQISNLSKKYGETVVFSDLNYTFENACIYGLVGRNGAGKTTLLNILSNYDKNYTGVISIDRKKMNKVDYLDMPVAYAMDQPSFLMS